MSHYAIIRHLLEEQNDCPSKIRVLSVAEKVRSSPFSFKGKGDKKASGKPARQELLPFLLYKPPTPK